MQTAGIASAETNLHGGVSMATKTKKANPKKTTTNRSKANLPRAIGTTTIRGNVASTSSRKTMMQLAKGKGAAGASPAPKGVARPSGETKTGGGKGAGGKRGC
jgi:hypothetical protein